MTFTKGNTKTQIHTHTNTEAILHL